MFFIVPLILSFMLVTNNIGLGVADTECPVVSSYADRRPNKNTLRLVQYNVEWLFIDYDSESKCPGSGCSWSNTSEASTHLSYVSKVITDLKPDIINLCEVEGCDELSQLQSNLKSSLSLDYNYYLKKGSDSATGQNVAMLTLIDPLINLYRTEERYAYPIKNSRCGYTGEPSTSGVSKHYITEFSIDSLKIAMISAHLIAYPTDASRCAQREAQAQVLQDVIANYTSKNYEIIMLGDLNDYDGEVLDLNNDVPISYTLDILKGLYGNHASAYKLTNIAELIDKDQRYSNWWDKNGNCASASNEFTMIDHLLVTDGLKDKIVNSFIYHEYEEYCGTYNSDHYPVVIDLLL